MFPPFHHLLRKYINAMQSDKTRIFISEMVLHLSFLSVAKKSLDPKQKLTSLVVLRNILTVIKMEYTWKRWSFLYTCLFFNSQQAKLYHQQVGELHNRSLCRNHKILVLDENMENRMGTQIIPLS